VVDEGDMDRNNVDDADVDLDDDEENSRSMVGWGNPIVRAQARLVVTRMGRARETLARVRCVWGAGVLYSGPASSGVRSNRLVPFDVASLRLGGSFGSMLSLHLCGA
jgi:hypothetical protein